MSKPRGAAVTTAKLTAQERAAIATAMQRHGGVERRQHTRMPLSEDFPLVVRFEQAEESPYFNVTPRDISGSGLGFFHVAYVHLDTIVQMIMKNRAGEAVCIKGTVSRCRHVSGRLHEVGVMFDTAIQVEVFVHTPNGESEVHTDMKPSDIYKRVTAVSEQLKSLASQYASFDSMLERVGELAVLLAPFDAGYLERMDAKPDSGAAVTDAVSASEQPAPQPAHAKLVSSKQKHS